MAHIPVNHPLRPVYRTIAGLGGLYLFLYGVVGMAVTWGDPLFGREDVWALGLRANLASAIASLLFGATVVAAAVFGGRAEHLVNLAAGVVALATGLVMLTLLRHANFLNFSVANVIVSFVLGMVFLTAGLYDKVGSAADADTEDGLRHGRLRMPHGVSHGRAG
ncbi:protein of unknown function [Micromonospora pattaloongensis]|uniref:DUF4383 domain-containing protein n=1 Tax=Micromonospora pattaloongensis TaxID=405436 RepID=A0A1H3GIQ8_9ACTN|nr:DUF4383 domain-containing protein [Micromonospora pattaloongensis]SDY03193.1 protein of unknown function [Micromonospora pattaloongensis]